MLLRRGGPQDDSESDQLQEDEALARRLQSEELSGSGIPFPGLSPQPRGGRVSGGNGASFTVIRRSDGSIRRGSLIRPAAGPARANIADDLSEAQNASPVLLLIFAIIYTAEFLLTVIILSLTWNQECDKPLKFWLLIFTSRVLFMLPIRVHLYARARRSEAPNPNYVQFDRGLKFFTFLWFIVGQAWIYSSSTCSDTSPALYFYSLTLIIFVYISLALPILILLGICICLPCVLIALRFVGDNRGAPVDVISRLPTRKYTSSNPSSAAEDKPSCAVCMYDFEEGQDIRTLPCNHEFHNECVDRWLRIKKECPLCRGDVTHPRV